MAPTAVRMTLKWRVAQGEAVAIVSALQRLMVRARAGQGCTGCSLATNVGERVDISCIADWTTEADMRRQVQSSDFAQLAELIEHATEQPTIEFTLPTGTRGLEYATNVRRHQHR
jgi:quinol monooxygenase YgiN